VNLDFHFGNSQEHCMKKLVFATAMALAGISLVSTPALRAQDSGQTIQIQDPAEFNAYQNYSTQTDPAQKCAAGESFLKTYPQSQVKKEVLTGMVQCYQQSNNPDGALGAATRLLQLDPGNMPAIVVSVYLKKQQCAKSLDASGVSSDAQTCDDAATLAQKGLTATKPASTSDGDWKNITAQAYPVFRSTIAFDCAVSKKDFKCAEDEYTKELNLYALADCSKPGPCLADTLQLAQAYAKPGDARNEIKAIWFYARAWDYAPPAYKAQIEPQLEYWYKRYHGTLDGDAAIKQQVDGIKQQAQATLFPPDGFTIAPAPSPAELAHKAYTTGDPMQLNLEDKEFILANGSKDDADGLWAKLKGQQTPVPGIVISDPANVLKISVTTAASVKPKDFVVKLTTPGACGAVPPAPTELKIKDAQAYILANGVKADTDAMGDVLTDAPAKVHKLSVEPAIGTFNVAVTQDAKDAHTADFTVNMKDPVSCKEAPAAGSELKTQPAMELDGTYDTYTQVPAAGQTAASAQIVLSGGFLQAEAKKGAAVHHVPAKPSAAHHAQ
jgi:tetratricopeptide (TPR) repeat protein